MEECLLSHVLHKSTALLVIFILIVPITSYTLVDYIEQKNEQLVMKMKWLSTCARHSTHYAPCSYKAMVVTSKTENNSESRLLNFRSYSNDQCVTLQHCLFSRLQRMTGKHEGTVQVHPFFGPYVFLYEYGRSRRYDKTLQSPDLFAFMRYPELTFRES